MNPGGLSAPADGRAKKGRPESRPRAARRGRSGDAAPNVLPQRAGQIDERAVALVRGIDVALSAVLRQTPRAAP